MMKRLVKKISVIGGIALVLITVALVLFGSSFKNEILFARSCDTSHNIFTSHIVDVEKIDHIVPLGNLNPPGHTLPTKHMYFNFEAGSKVNVKAPASMHITSMRSAKYMRNGTMDYEISFTPCRNISGYFIHLDTLSPLLKEALDEAEKDDCRTMDTGQGDMEECFLSVDVVIEEGSDIGTVKVTDEGFAALDFGLVDQRVEAPYVAGESMVPDDYASVVCPLDYFSDNLKKELYGKVGGRGQIRTEEPRCGTVHQDVIGRAQGSWFNANRSEGFSQMTDLALVHDNIDPNRSVMSIGQGLQELGIHARTIFFEGKDGGYINRDFKDVSPDGNVYCYEFPLDANYTVLLQMLDENTLLVGKGSDRRCTENRDMKQNITFKR